MNKVFYLVLLSSLASAPLLAERVPTTAPTAPTTSSEPLPTMQETHNHDTVLTERVQSVIVNVKSLQGQAVSAASENGVITLEGSVETKAQEQMH